MHLGEFRPKSVVCVCDDSHSFLAYFSPETRFKPWLHLMHLGEFRPKSVCVCDESHSFLAYFSPYTRFNPWLHLMHLGEFRPKSVCVCDESHSYHAYFSPETRFNPWLYLMRLGEFRPKSSHVHVHTRSLETKSLAFCENPSGKSYSILMIFWKIMYSLLQRENTDYYIITTSKERKQNPISLKQLKDS